MRSFILLGLSLGLSAATPLRAQQALYVSDGERAMHLVRKIVDGVPYTLEKGKLEPLVPASTGRSTSFLYALKPAEEFYPAFVTLKNFKTTFPNFNMESVRRLERRFSFSGAVASDYPLKNVFLVFEFDLADAPAGYRGVWAKGIAPYELAESKDLFQEILFPDNTPRTTVKFHVFSDGVEVFHSDLPRALVEEKLARMASKRMEKSKDAPARPLAGPMPRYPEKFRKTKTTGRAIVSCEIAANGQPVNLAVTSATDPAFGEAALAVMSQWWFVPAVVGGQPVATKAELPFEFAPPKS